MVPGRTRCVLQAGRFVSARLAARHPQVRTVTVGTRYHETKERRPRERTHIPKLDVVTYEDRMHYVPGLAKPAFPQWERDYADPRFYRAPSDNLMPLYKERACYVFNQRSSMLEGATVSSEDNNSLPLSDSTKTIIGGVRQAAWLTKTKLTPGLPPELLASAKKAENQMSNQDERVQDAIKHARFWDATEKRPRKEKYSNTLLLNLLHLCTTLQSRYPAVRRRILAENYSLAATWNRGEDLFQIRGQNGLLHSSMDPLPEVCSKDEVYDTTKHVLETFYPISPTIDLQKVHVYKEQVNCTGFRDDYLYPHAHTLYFLESVDAKFKLRPEQFRAKMVMFAFGNALARAHRLYGTHPQQILNHPVTVQAVGTNGRIFQFLVFQLNTTDLSVDEGIKNQMWLDEDVELYEFAKVQPLIKKKQVKVPAGLAGYKPEAFSKFLALFLHGAL